MALRVLFDGGLSRQLRQIDALEARLTQLDRLSSVRCRKHARAAATLPGRR